jgi:hypothetical protein
MVEKEVELFIDKEGCVTLLHDDEITDALWHIGHGSITRASRIEPQTSRKSSQALWCVRMVVVKPHFWLWYLPSYQRALEIEKEWLSVYFRTGKKLRYDSGADCLVEN